MVVKIIMDPALCLMVGIKQSELMSSLICTWYWELSLNGFHLPKVLSVLVLIKLKWIRY